MTRKDYKILAEALNRARCAFYSTPDAQPAIRYTTQCIADALAANNPRFDRDKFYYAAGMPVQ